MQLSIEELRELLSMAPTPRSLAQLTGKDIYDSHILARAIFAAPYWEALSESNKAMYCSQAAQLNKALAAR